MNETRRFSWSLGYSAAEVNALQRRQWLDNIRRKQNRHRF